MATDWIENIEEIREYENKRAEGAKNEETKYETIIKPTWKANQANEQRIKLK